MSKATAEWNLGPAFAIVDRGRAKIQQLGEQILAESNRNAPVETGALRASGAVTMDHNRAIVHYDAPHAVIVHERLDVRHTTGGPKFLENALLDTQRRIESELGGAVRI